MVDLYINEQINKQNWLLKKTNIEIIFVPYKLNKLLKKFLKANILKDK